MSERQIDDISKKVIESLQKTGLVQVEVSARHVHLTSEHIEILFGRGASLTPKRELSQPGQYLSEERVTLVGPKGKKERTAVLGPARPATQVELSKSDCIQLGVVAPYRESGDVSGSGGITIEGPMGSITIAEGVIIARSHIHMLPETAQMLELKDKQKIQVEMLTERPVVFKDVVVRVSSQFRNRMHIDFDEANAAAVEGFVLGKIIKD